MADAALADALARHLAERHGAAVQRVETHISWLLLCGEHAYKLKKSVALGFLDFTDPAARRHFCEEELRLNRRLAPSLYLAVRPVCGTPAAPVLDGPGPVLDHVLCMRRFADDALLATRLAEGRLDTATVQALARRLARFHRSAPAAPPGAPWGQAAQVEEALQAVVQRLQQATGAARPELEAALAAQRPAWHQAWARRHAAGAVREGHGDLHLANTVLLEDGPTAFDALEFDPALRWIDPASDLAFLTMDLAVRGRPDLAAAARDAWLEEGGDWEALTVWRGYEIYRALVRALVAALQGPGHPGPDYLGWACARAGERPRPRLLITHGLSGAGKSTWSQALLQATGAVRLRSDVERKRLAGLAPLDDSRRHGLDLYTPEHTARTFDVLLQRAEAALHAGWPVVVDAAFLRVAERARFAALAARLGLPWRVLDCQRPEAERARRLVQRQARGDDPSEAGVALLARQAALAEPLEPAERAAAITVGDVSPAALADVVARWT